MYKTKKPVQKDRFSLQGGMVAVVYRLAYCQTGAMVVPVFVFYFLSTDAKHFVALHHQQVQSNYSHY